MIEATSLMDMENSKHSEKVVALINLIWGGSVKSLHEKTRLPI